MVLLERGCRVGRHGPWGLGVGSLFESVGVGGWRRWEYGLLSQRLGPGRCGWCEWGYGRVLFVGGGRSLR